MIRSDLNVGDAYWLKRKSGLVKVVVVSIDDKKKVVKFKYLESLGKYKYTHKMLLSEFYQRVYLKSHLRGSE